MVLRGKKRTVSSKKSPSKNSTVSVILPTYNEKENIKIIIPKIQDEFFKKYNIKGEIIIVDDTSPDGTAKVAQALAKKYNTKQSVKRGYNPITVIIKKDKEGIGAALRVGYNAAKYQIILSSDVDLGFDVKDMIRLITKIQGGYDVVVGSRYITSGNYENPTLALKLKSFVSKTGNTITRIVSGLKIHDFSANFRAMKKKVWKKIKTQENTNSLLLEMLVKSHYTNHLVGEISVKFKKRIYGESKIDLKKEAPKFFYKLFYYTLRCRILRMNK